MNQAKPSYHGYGFSAEIISHAVWLYHWFSLSFRDVEDLLAEQGIIASYETIRNWCSKFGRSMHVLSKAQRFLAVHSQVHNLFRLGATLT